MIHVIPRKDGTHRRLVYLDQNVLSGVALGRVGGGSGGQKLAAAQLRFKGALKNAVLERQAAVCVESGFHRVESSPLNDADFEEMQRFIGYHSFGLEFRTRHEAIEAEVFRSVAGTISGFFYGPEHLWRFHFSRDPNDRNEKHQVLRGMVMVAGWRKDPTNQSDDDTPPTTAPSYADALRSMQDGLREAYLVVAQEESWGHSWSSNIEPLLSGGRRMTQDDVERFIASEDFLALPAIHTRCELSARVNSDQTRKPKQNDEVDLEVLSLAIPLCDLVLTDSFMAEKAKQGKLPAKFETLVLPGNAKGLDKAAAWLDNLTALPKRNAAPLLAAQK